ncbi:MAG: ADP-glyceromanno-heptose 6-epimerase [Bacteroidota bacterium]|jgi:ADP-L-glycero-D-manno-heptose 6-epimerase
MIVLTGTAGFIGSYFLGFLNSKGITNIAIVDDFSREEKLNNWSTKKFEIKIDRNQFIPWLELNSEKIDFVFHLGARTDTTLMDWKIFEELNLNYTKSIWEICANKNIPLVYASSAATYGNGELGYDDIEKNIPQLKPLNPYGDSKQLFDEWALQQTNQPPFWAGLKFFNVYGPNEYHKGRMASVIFHSFNQISGSKKIKLFKSHKQGIENGHQKRDFVYVKDLCSVLYFLMEQRKSSGIYNLGSGTARNFLDLAHSVFKTLNLPPKIEFIDTPLDIRDNYQYYTCATMEKLKEAGYTNNFISLEEGIDDYVQNYLLSRKYF